MQNAGQGGEKKSYRVILLLVVGLAAYSNAMKDLNEVRALTLETSSLLAQWSDKLVPSHAIRVETCQNQIPLPPPPPLQEVRPLPPTPVVPVELVQPNEQDEVRATEPVTPEVAPLPPAPPRVREVPAPKPRRMVRASQDCAEVRVSLATDQFLEKNIKSALEADLSLKTLKARNRRHLWITTDGKDVILKTLNRSINLRSAS